MNEMPKMQSLLDAEPDGGDIASSGHSSKGSKRPFKETPLAQGLVVLFFLVAVGFGVWGALRGLGGTGDVYPRIRIMNSNTGELAWHRLDQQNTLLPEGFHLVEYCFEKQCGPDGGTPVVLNTYLHIPEMTYCPKCGSEVYSHNPRPPQYEATKPKDQL